MKTCTHCTKEKPFDAFYASSTHKSGYTSWCKVCESGRSKAKNQRNRDARLVKAKQWRDANKDKQTAATQSWREKNKEHYKNYFVEYAKSNRGKINAKWMQRDAAKKMRTPPWLDAQMKKQIEVEYSLAAWCTQVMNESYHVDHIVPLQGKTVSGLHVPCNLQVIPAKLNQQKSNHF